ncbi:MAG: DUF4258 domain-containing protein [Acidobacteria bacterium]|nr:DUF4258 domain-containing protein [Acidobacteriota bacterium]
MAFDDVYFSDYARKRMFERRISVAEVRQVLADDDRLEDYSDGRYLVLGWVGIRAIHVAAEDDILAQVTTVVTVYEPDLRKWKPGFRQRKRKS